MPEDTIGHHVFIIVKVLNTECWDPVLFVLYRENLEKFCSRMNIGNEIGRSVAVFHVFQKRMTHVKPRPYG